jgi:hypothetical protein
MFIIPMASGFSWELGIYHELHAPSIQRIEEPPARLSFEGFAPRVLPSTKVRSMKTCIPFLRQKNNVIVAFCHKVIAVFVTPLKDRLNFLGKVQVGVSTVQENFIWFRVSGCSSTSKEYNVQLLRLVR